MKYLLAFQMIFFSFPPMLRCQDKGVGLIHFYFDSLADIQEFSEILIYEKKDVTSNVLAKFIRNPSDSFEGFIVESNSSISNNLVEYEYDIYGLPFDSLSHDKNWARVIIGTVVQFRLTSSQSLSKKLLGWVDLRKGNTEFFFWKDYLQTKNLFFLLNEDIEFYEKINSSEPTIFNLDRLEFDQEKYDYHMLPLFVKGCWMKVKVVTPSDLCDGRPRKREGNFWIKFLDKFKRPKVWYYVRGC